ncbi:molecular chaperone [Enterovibrio norvegicus]|uniref:Chaperone protein skp n=2 Tax=Enterovibrio norvegicus TaxID=188144 RepID=A0A1I5WE60_9GAMM|nr:OmpH family outer membrane protein [Enterovibrio norvegicus]MCC4799307.1 OmpH family outer membrane protein [Enterovibrio norvegicus]OEE68587.1 molecular chaperone [Enterovibrio norvegicus]OEF51276.1 molecular chaperone [Enterovibrio norvegicus]OEF59000.1 molecular chaperone [Enterovibrio norvegicus]PMH62008.1 molecular chaperone [Enterovibrio norvegicus]
MKPFIKAAGLSLAILSASMYASAAEAAQKIGYVSTGPVIAQMAKQSNVSEKLRREFKDRIAEVERLEGKLKKGVDKLKRNGELMSDKERTKLQRELQSLDADYKLKVNNLKEDERKRSAEEQRKLIEKLQKAIASLAKKEGYDMILDRQAVLFASPKDDLSEKVLKAVK